MIFFIIELCMCYNKQSMPYVNALLMGKGSHPRSRRTWECKIQLLDPSMLADNTSRRHIVNTKMGIKYYIHYKFFKGPPRHAGGYSTNCSISQLHNYLEYCAAHTHYLVEYDSIFMNPRNMSYDEISAILPYRLMNIIKKIESYM